MNRCILKICAYQKFQCLGKIHTQSLNSYELQKAFNVLLFLNYQLFQSHIIFNLLFLLVHRFKM